MHRLIIAITIMFILLIIYNIYFYRGCLNGLWVADDKFCNSAGIDSLIFYINTSTDKIHVIMNKSDTELYNDTDSTYFYLNYALPIIQKTKYYKVHSDGKGFLPEKCSAKLNITKSTIKIYDNEKCYAKLRKF